MASSTPSRGRRTPAPAAARRTSAPQARRGTSARTARRRQAPPPARRPAAPAKRKRRNPNRWRFYVLLGLLGLIAATVLWLTVGREAWAAFWEERQSGAEQTDPGSQADETDHGSSAGPGGDGAGDTDNAGSTAQEAPAVGGTEPDEHALANPVECRSAALAVDLDVGSRSHPVAEPVPVAVTVANTGPVPCLVNLGHESMQVDITSGDDDIWSNSACPQGDATRDLLLDIEAEVQRTITWDASRCGSGDAAAEGTYVITVKVPATGGPVTAEQVIELS